MGSAGSPSSFTTRPFCTCAMTPQFDMQARHDVCTSLTSSAAYALSLTTRLLTVATPLPKAPAPAASAEAFMKLRRVRFVLDMFPPSRSLVLLAMGWALRTLPRQTEARKRSPASVVTQAPSQTRPPASSKRSMK